MGVVRVSGIVQEISLNLRVFVWYRAFSHDVTAAILVSKKQ